MDKIIITNDGKGKAQSFEASVELSSENKYWGLFNSNFIGYGVDEFSAKHQMVEQINTLIERLQSLKSKL